MPDQAESCGRCGRFFLDPELGHLRLARCELLPAWNLRVRRSPCAFTPSRFTPAAA